MKKVLGLAVVLSFMFLMSGCEKVSEQGNYKEGTYFGYDKYNSYGEDYVTTATIYVDGNGLIKSVFIDSTYNKDNVYTTKKTLGDDYGMKETSANIGVIPGGAEWYEQIKSLEDKIISEQGLDWVKWSDAEKTKLDVDTISGVTITANTYINAVSNALNEAK
ncbi:MAG: FMN-binding protein [Bacilli bacterium]|nr:FMN-binding protein [Bacilli bacterium]